MYSSSSASNQARSHYARIHKARPAEDGSEYVAPIPDHCPTWDHLRRTRGGLLPSSTWTYQDEAGKPLFHRMRFDPPGRRKRFRTITLWRNAAGNLEWRISPPPGFYPLYGLPGLANYPKRQVIVVEGEKACDAAARIFPDCLCVTSLNGALAARHTDWSPLSDRDVIIAPDVDESGARYAQDVATLVYEQELDPSRSLTLTRSRASRLTVQHATSRRAGTSATR